LCLLGDSSSDEGVQFRSIVSSEDTNSVACITDISVALGKYTQSGEEIPISSTSDSSSDCDVLSLDCSDFENIDEQEIIHSMNSQKVEKTKLREAKLEQQPSAVQQTPEVVDLEADVPTMTAIPPPPPFVWVAPPAVFLAPSYQNYVYQAPAPHMMHPILQNFQPYFPPSGYQHFHPFQEYPCVARAPSTSRGPNLPINDLRHHLSRR
jgi:hypothetical protein